MQSLLDHLHFDLWGQPLLDWSGRLLTALLILLVGLWLARRFAALMRRAIERRGGDAVLANFLRNTVFVALALVVIVGALDRTGVPTGSLLAALGAAGLAVGLALKDSLGNLASGVLLIVTRPFRAGDFVEISGSAGTVERIDLLQTVLVSADNKVIAVPNALVMNAAIVNYTARAQRRLDLLVNVPFDSDLHAAFQAIDGVLRADPRVLTEPAPQVLVLRLAEHGVEVGVRPWVKTAELLPAQSELLSAIKAALLQRGISPPVPQRIMRMVQGEAARAEVPPVAASTPAATPAKADPL